MKKDLLVVNRWLVENKSISTAINTSLIMTNFDRRYLEKMRKAKNISTKVYEIKIGLTKSRYYRWVNNDVDLPMELIVGIKKILGLSNYELMNIMGPETEEGLNFLCGMIFSIINGLPIQKYKDELYKHVKVLTHEQPYDRILILFNLLIAQCGHKAFDKFELFKLINWVNSLESYTLMDAIIVITILSYYDFSNLKEQPLSPVLLETWIFKNIVNDLFSFRKISIGIGIDLSLFYIKNNLTSNAIELIKRMKEELKKNSMLDPYSHYILMSLNNIFLGNIESKKKIYQDLSKAKVFLPTLELKFWKDVLV